MKVAALIFASVISYFGHCQTAIPQTNFALASEEDFKSLVSSFENRTPNRALAKTLFNKAHRKFLKHYSAYAQVKDILEKGNYDCLSGTYFLATALDQLHFSYKIIETNYHIFMIVQTAEGEVLFESTDRYHGFVTDREAIKEKLNNYQSIEVSSNNQRYLSSYHLFRELPYSQLSGLLYFNQAVDAFHRKDLTSTCLYLEQAWKIYDNPRIDEFTPILIHTIALSDLDETKKKQLTSVLREHQRSSIRPTLASR